jgi:heterodisulfide reductase subunit D
MVEDLESTETHPLESPMVRKLPVSTLEMTRLIQMQGCTRCGECLNWCPVYDQDPREAILPRKKIQDFLQIVKTQQGLLARFFKGGRTGESLKKIVGPLFGYRDIGPEAIETFVRNLYECSTCGQCQIVCPANIDTINLWEDIRRLIVSADYGPLESQKILVKSVKSYDNPWQQPRAARTKWIRRAQKDNEIAAPPREIKKTGGKVLLFLGCTAVYDVNVKQIAVSTINILEHLGIDYGCLGGDEKCCGSVLLRMGDKEFERIASDNIKQLNSLNIHTLVSSCSGCFKTIKEDYPKVGKLGFEVLHTVEFLTRMVEAGTLRFTRPVERTITYHDPCHLGRASGVFDEPRVLIKAIPGLDLIEMPRSRQYSRCCGAGGGLKAGFPDIQNKMSQRRIKEAEATGAQELVSACPFCYAGLQVGIKALESPLVMRDLSYLVEESLKP